MVKFNLYMTPLSDLMGIFDGLSGVGEQFRHLFCRFKVILSSLIAHTILICHLFAGLDAQQDIMRLGICVVNIMHIVRSHQIDGQIFTHAQKSGIHRLLLRNPVVL